MKSIDEYYLIQKQSALLILTELEDGLSWKMLQ